MWLCYYPMEILFLFCRFLLVECLYLKNNEQEEIVFSFTSKNKIQFRTNFVHLKNSLDPDHQIEQTLQRMKTKKYPCHVYPAGNSRNLMLLILVSRYDRTIRRSLARCKSQIFENCPLAVKKLVHALIKCFSIANRYQALLQPEMNKLATSNVQ